MKHLLFLLLVISNALSSVAQTKKETADWLTFYLNKFNGHPANVINGQGYIDSYGFYGDSLVVSQYNEFGDSASWKTVWINLKKVVKVEIFTDTAVSPSAHLPCYKIWLYFNPPQYVQDTPPVTMVESKGGKHVRYNWANPYELDFGDWEILENSMPQRIQKALSHLVTLDGGKIIKEVF